jgi:tetratricopeptide (TPR) repeat protein
LRKNAWICFLLTGLLTGMAYTPSAAGSGEGYWVPVDPPKCHYVIDAKIDLDEGFIGGTETVTLKNNFDRAIDVVALDWRISQSYAIDVWAEGEPLVLLNGADKGSTESPLFYRLPESIEPGRQIRFRIEFENRFEVDGDNTSFARTSWYPRLRWDGLPIHDSFSVKLDIPEGYALAVSGRLDENTGRYEIDGARTFGIHLAKDQTSETRMVDGIQVTTLFTEKGARAAEVCMDTALDAIAYYKDWLGFYPHEFLYIIPGGPGRWGGYPFATGIVVIHGEETFKEGEPLSHWQRITAHEIGHEYWGEWVLDPERPAWVWIGMGIFADTEYILARGIDPGRRQSWMSNYLSGTAMYNDTTVDIPPAQLAKIRYDHNNTVIHSKGFSIVSALDCVLGREAFESIYKKCLQVYGGRRLGWRELQRFFEKESGENLSWFFDQWVRSNAYLCYKIVEEESKREGDVFKSLVKVKRLGTMEMPVPVKAVFVDGSEQVKTTDRSLETSQVIFTSKSELKEAVIDPEHKLAMLEKPLAEISDAAAEMLSLGWSLEDSPEIYEKLREENITNPSMLYRIGMGLYEYEDYPAAFDCFGKITKLATDEITRFAAFGWLGLLKDVMGEREEALGYYELALNHDTGESMSHSWLRIQMDRKWVEERLKTPFSFETLVDIPAQPTAEELRNIVDSLNWKREGKTPFLIYEKTKGLNIENRDFWFKLGMLLFDSGYYPESFAAMEHVSQEGTSKLMIFAAYTWMGHLKDLLGEREEALKYYRLALEHDTGDAMTHSQFGMRIDRAWVEKRLAVPFTWRKHFQIRDKETVKQAETSAR